MVTPTLKYGRRVFLGNAAGLLAGSLLGVRKVYAEAPLETKKIRLVKNVAICLAPQYLAEELLRAEGFSDIEYVKVDRGTGLEAVADGRVDLTQWDTQATLPFLDQGKPLTILAGIHGGCYELFGNDGVRSIKDLKGKTIAITAWGNGDHILISSILAYVGISPQNDVRWLVAPSHGESMQLFLDGKADAFLANPPMPQDMRAKKVGHVIVDTALDQPWAQYFCCAVTAHRDFVKRHPVATKRALRALLKATDLCAQQPERAARFLASKGFEPRYDIALSAMKDVDYRRWRDSSPEDTLRFHALRLHEAGMVRSTPEKLIAQGTDWRFLNELKKELKA
jgi:NitT/TauT family transport system substrate-binding protein